MVTKVTRDWSQREKTKRRVLWEEWRSRREYQNKTKVIAQVQGPSSCSCFPFSYLKRRQGHNWDFGVSQRRRMYSYRSWHNVWWWTFPSTPFQVKNGQCKVGSYFTLNTINFSSPPPRDPFVGPQGGSYSFTKDPLLNSLPLRLSSLSYLCQITTRYTTPFFHDLVTQTPSLFPPSFVSSSVPSFLVLREDKVDSLNLK